MNAGDLRHLITIETPTITQGDYGEPTVVWSTFKTIRVSIEPLRGREFFDSEKFNSEVTHKIKMRYLGGLTSKMRIKFGTRYFNILSVININERNRELHLMCAEGNNNEAVI